MLSVSHGVGELAAAHVADGRPPQDCGYWSPPVGQQREQVEDADCALEVEVGQAVASASRYGQASYARTRQNLPNATADRPSAKRFGQWYVVFHLPCTALPEPVRPSKAGDSWQAARNLIRTSGTVQFIEPRTCGRCSAVCRSISRWSPPQPRRSSIQPRRIS